MISRELLDGLNLPPEKAKELQNALRKDDFYRTVLYKAGIMPAVIPTIMRVTDTGGIDETQEELYIEKAKVEYSDFIPKRGNTK